MGIWQKKIKSNRKARFIGIIWFTIFSLLVTSGIANILRGLSLEAYEKSYFDTWEFQSGYLIKKAGYIRDWIVRYPDESVFEYDNIDVEEYRSYFEYYPDSEMPNDESESDDENKEVQLPSQEEIDRVKKQVIRDRKAYYKVIEVQLQKEELNLDFYARNNTTGQVITNIAGYSGVNDEQIIERLKLQPGYFLGDETGYYKDQGYIEHAQYISNYYRANNLEAPIIGDDYEIHVAVSQELEPYGELYEESQLFQNFIRPHYYCGIISLIIGVFGILVVLQYLTYREGREDEENGKQCLSDKLDKIPFEIQFAGIMMIGFLCSYIICECVYNIVDISIIFSVSKINEVIMVVIGTVLAILILNVYLSCIRHMKHKTFWTNTLIKKLMTLLGNTVRFSVQEKFLVGTILITFCLYTIMSLFLCELFWWDFSTFVYLIFLGVVVSGISILLVIEYKAIVRGIKRIEEGELDHKVESRIKVPILGALISGINCIGEGLHASVEQRIRSEKFKTELITNVSHDLKTPLTSIISYIDLLKQEKIENDCAKEYIDIISESGEKLKILIYDLVEASKAATGNLQVTLEEVDLTQFVQQAVGEYSDRLNQNGLEIILQQEEHALVQADGRHLWRIMDNLLSNVSKYSMANTRVYIETRKVGKSVQLTIKNISSVQLSVDASELTERFVRGDASRTQEGSGLGLSIAKSLVELQNGDFDIILDGDLFKVMVTIPSIG